MNYGMKLAFGGAVFPSLSAESCFAKRPSERRTRSPIHSPNLPNLAQRRTISPGCGDEASGDVSLGRRPKSERLLQECEKDDANIVQPLETVQEIVVIEHDTGAPTVSWGPIRVVARTSETF